MKISRENWQFLFLYLTTNVSASEWQRSHHGTRAFLTSELLSVTRADLFVLWILTFTWDPPWPMCSTLLELPMLSPDSLQSAVTMWILGWRHYQRTRAYIIIILVKKNNKQLHNQREVQEGSFQNGMALCGFILCTLIGATSCQTIPSKRTQTMHLQSLKASSHLVLSHSMASAINLQAALGAVVRLYSFLALN